MNITRGRIAAFLLGAILAFPAFFGASWARDQVVSGYPQFAEGDELWARKTGTTNTKQDLESTSGALHVRIASSTSVPVTETTPTAADVLAGYQSFTATTAATTIITVPATRTWVGEVNVNCVTAIAAASATAGQATGTVTTAGVGVTPAAGTYLSCDGRAGANAATGTVGSNAEDDADAADFIVVAPAGNAVTLQCTSTIAGTFGRVTCAANGRLL